MEDNNTTHYPEEGEIILIDKDLYWTSFDVVSKVKNVLCSNYGLKKLKVGHAGTLDPLATGLVIVCTGKQTKNIQLYQDEVKEYVATIKLGGTTPSFDLETKIDKTFPYEHITTGSVLSMLESFIGLQDQVPPSFSAKNLNGKRAYEYARKGQEISLKPKQIEFFTLELVHFELPLITVRIICSKGTYIRAFARDLGTALNSGAHLTDLRRTRIGPYHVGKAFSVNQFIKKTELINSGKDLS